MIDLVKKFKTKQETFWVKRFNFFSGTRANAQLGCYQKLKQEDNDGPDIAHLT